ncbi:hypothetical protein [Virgisporangium aurantiacum]|uniref:hypothetical protein n=1 Tax=Virgisporangium aurantiacum TaxID=175570 RepID=UPI0019522D24|nr:hypothetical protein [Virgisporangium aurantiacum]
MIILLRRALFSLSSLFMLCFPGSVGGAGVRERDLKVAVVTMPGMSFAHRNQPILMQVLAAVVVVVAALARTAGPDWPGRPTPNRDGPR